VSKGTAGNLAGAEPLGLEKRDAELLRRVVDPRGAARRIRLARYAPSAALAPFVEHLWVVEWNLDGRPPETQRTIPDPVAHLVFEPGRTALYGVVRGAFQRRGAGHGRILGLRFRPGGLRPLIDVPMSRLTGRTVSVAPLLGIADAAAESIVLGAPGDDGMVAAAESLIANRLPAADPTVDRVGEIIAHAATAGGPTRAGELATRAGMSLRALQRLFAEYVGVPPKWVIARFRLQEAAYRLARGESLNLATLATELGYFDQAHLTRAFTRLVGQSPAEYQLSQSAE
jgi:AraC-like DNA-binding protein